MDEFRRPLGVLIASVLIGAVGYLLMAALRDSTLALFASWVVTSACWLAGVGAIAVIAWRLIRRRPETSGGHS